VTAKRRGNVLFQALLGLVLGVLLQLVGHVSVNRLALVMRDEVIAKHAYLQSALVTVESGCPRIVGIQCMVPRAMLPDDRQVVIFEVGGLRI
jgi:hypothetical protein